MGRMGDPWGGWETHREVISKLTYKISKIMNCHLLELTGDIEDPVEAVVSVWGPL